MLKLMLIVLFILIPQFAFGGVYFESSWNTATGTNCNAVQDGGYWNWAWTEGCNPPPGICKIEIFSGGPGGNNLAAIYQDVYDWNAVKETNLQYVNDTHFYYRFYIRVYPAIGWGFNQGHYVENDSGSPINNYFGIQNVSSTHWKAYTTSARQITQHGYPYNQFETAMDLNVNEWYRIECHIYWLDHTSSAQTLQYFRIYDSNNVLVKDNDDWFRQDSSSYTLTNFYTAGNYFHYDGTKSDWKMGCNGPATAFGSGRVCDFSCVVLADDDWIGAIDAVGDTTPPTVTITQPTSGTTYLTEQDTINVSGTASDNVGVTSVTWINDRGGSGTASGTDNWTLSNISLQIGNNVITVTAHDAAGNTNTDVLTITRDVVSPPTLENLSPADEATGVLVGANISFDIRSLRGRVDINEIDLTIGGVDAIINGVFQVGYIEGSFIAVVGTGYYIVVNPADDFGYGEVINLTVYAEDTVDNSVSLTDWNFTTETVGTIVGGGTGIIYGGGSGIIEGQ